MIRYLTAILALCIATFALAQSAPRTVGPLPDTRVYSWIDALPAKGSHRYDDFTAKGVDRTYTHIGVRIQDGSERVTIDGGTWRDAGSPEKIGAAFALVAGSMTLRNVNSIGNRGSVVAKTTYPNRDGIMAAKNTKLTVIGGYYRQHWDGGIDTKGDTFLDKVTLEGNALNLRCWGKLEATTIASKWPIKGHVQGNPGCVAHIALLKVFETGPTTLVGIGKGQTIIIDRCQGKRVKGGRDIYYQSGATPAEATVRLGPGCKA